MNAHTTNIIVQAIGYFGGVTTLYAYYMVSSGRTKGDSLHYQFYNIIGALCLIVNTAYMGAFPSMGVNIIWVVVAVYSLRKSGVLNTAYDKLRGRKKV